MQAAFETTIALLWLKLEKYRSDNDSSALRRTERVKSLRVRCISLNNKLFRDAVFILSVLYYITNISNESLADTSRPQEKNTKTPIHLQ